MKDPVNDFEIPEEWLAKSTLPRAEVEDLVSRGLIVVLSDGSFLKRGFTTGTTAAAAAKAATLSLGKTLSNGTIISVPTTIGLRAEMPVESAKDGDAGVRKVYNDHESDITRDVLFCAKVQKVNPKDSEFSAEKAKAVDNIFVTGGIGVGIIQRAGFETRVGEYAINPKPLAQIRESVKEALQEVGLFNEICVKKESAIIVSIYIPDGVALSKKTLNEKIGIVGGISILGTTGFVEPWNDHLGEMKDVLIQNAKKVVLTTGRQGMATSSMLFPGYEIVMVGSRISEGIDAAVSAEEIVVCGLPGLVLKWGNPDMLKDSGFATVVEVIEKDPGNPLLKQAFDMCVKKGKGARIVVIDREGLVLMDSKGEFDYLMKN
ncbi:cobalt-precorrin-5B (C(1))-methyltransferase [Methanimicrococcus blatticola]|uniref:Cobalt-precorrin-5B C(1)-methyltransferase n=1 Tax=Methanimicrococcus blatticola TaxID=91560 RepID=A0A484F7V7_9EURY|nr:cobalt-precorrin-5B (C(1))-methyltransferase [Methanimicrococcus blatticola]MBZ3934937.1 cobalt-precorrin-5B (C(1))-methyltransferase [Methanimicrococcus blatticola]MCC2508964.1 cobalt-precorrin-5B (C(1))-methyltransferase [Methanimicrococcus blatticola]TDQ71006.1 cobalt-precorrin-5B (C1)-methyltransferase [Methanimicrococcus blatticola]